LLRRYPHLVETPSWAPEERTTWNVRDSDATLIIVGSEGLDASPGTKLAVTCARETFERPWHVANLASPSALHDAETWLAHVIESIEPSERESLVLNVAGLRESESPGIYAAARGFLDELLDSRTK
jgi:putative molybdenum carrier protein